MPHAPRVRNAIPTPPPGDPPPPGDVRLLTPEQYAAVDPRNGSPLPGLIERAEAHAAAAALDAGHAIAPWCRASAGASVTRCARCGEACVATAHRSRDGRAFIGADGLLHPCAGEVAHV